VVRDFQTLEIRDEVKPLIMRRTPSTLWGCGENIRLRGRPRRPRRHARCRPRPRANRTALRKRLAGFTVPRLVEFAGAVSKTAAGKIRKPGSRDHYALTKENLT
jgi:acyl-CoA synthetase (AMP-forming)/AMP-acid ligase II